MQNLKIYFTSDLHGYVYPTDYVHRCKKPLGLLNIINQFNKDENTLIIDGGDTIQGSPFTNYLSNAEFHIHPMATIMNEAGYDYVTLGNHDFNYGYDYLKRFLNNLYAKCLCSNVKDKTHGLNILPCDIKVMGNGLKVGLMGFTTDFINLWERAESIENFEISDTFTSISSSYEELKKKADILIGIYHGGFEYDLISHKQLSTTKENIAYKICKDFEFDLLLTGHQHMEIPGEYLHGTYIAQTPNNGPKFLELNLNFHNDHIYNINSNLVNVELNPNKKMYHKYLELENQVEAWLDTPVGFLDTALHPTAYLDMAVNGSHLANFINQIELEESGAHIACTSFANYIKGFDKNVTVRDIMSTYMYPNTLIILEVTYDILKLALERCASYFDFKDGELCISDLFLKPKIAHYNYDYFSNINYSFDLNREVGQRVTTITYKGKPLHKDDTLNLVMNNYRASGAGGYEFYSNCKIVREIVVEMPEVIINYFRNNSKVVVDKTKYLTVLK